MSCNICCEDYNNKKYNKVRCLYCHFEACRTCCQTYILSETTPKCMNFTCGKEWSRKFLKNNFATTFLANDYKKHLENVLFEQEKALMPATQCLVEQRIEQRIKKTGLYKVNESIRHLEWTIKYKYGHYNPYNKNFFEEVDELRTELKKLYREKNELKKELGMATETKSKFYVRQCPNDICRGFLSSQWKCGICNKWTCPECHELKGDERDCEHVCDPNNVESAKLLAKDSKPCPKCQSLIFKIDGCDQMWCTQCHTAFSWKTGKLENQVHNPHYFEWQRNNAMPPKIVVDDINVPTPRAIPRNPGDIECGRELDNNASRNILHLGRKHLGFSNNTFSESISDVINIIKNIIHVMNVDYPCFQTDYVLKNQNLRMDYLENLITEEKFKTMLQRNDKKNRRNKEISQILEMTNTVITDIIYRIMENLKNSEPGKHHVELFMNEFNQLKNYCNENLSEISHTYNMTLYCFDKKFKFMKCEKN